MLLITLKIYVTKTIIHNMGIIAKPLFVSEANIPTKIKIDNNIAQQLIIRCLK